MTVRSGEQLEALTGLRGYAALWVMVLHFREYDIDKLWRMPVADEFFAKGEFGVELFFVLSGFIMTHVYRDAFRKPFRIATAVEYWRNRFARIFPVHAFTLALMAAIFGAATLVGASASTDRFSVGDFLLALSLVQAWVPHSASPNMPAWSVSAEAAAYLVFPALMFGARKSGWAPMVLFGIGATISGAAEWLNIGGHVLPRISSCFLAGIAARLFAGPSGFTSRISRFGGAICSLAIIAWVMLLAPHLRIVGTVLFALLICCLSYRSDRITSMFSNAIAVYLGEISYSIYMVHWPIRVVMREGFRRSGVLEVWPPAVIFLLYALVTLVFAALTYHVIERPGRNLLIAARKHSAQSHEGSLAQSGR